MKILSKQKVLFGLILSLGFGVGGCGNVNVDPLDLMSNSIPTLNSITAASGIGTYIQGTFSPATPYWVFNTAFVGVAQSYTAPANGQIEEIGLATNVPGATGYFVTILHSGRLATRIYGLQSTLGLKVGDYVLAGQVIAQYSTSSTVGFQVLFDGVPVCPFSYLSNAFRQSLISYTTAQLCQ